jgi:AcrR family transcriptional regulator
MKRKTQIAFSKKTISEAFFKLVKKYDFDKITISQIAAEAGISRATFYRHFDSLESIVKYTSDSFIQDGLDKLSKLESPTLKDLIRWRLEVARDLRYLVDIEEHPDIKNILKTVSPYRLQHFSHILDFATPYKVTFNFAGFQAVISLWAKNGYKETIDEMCDIIIELVGKN